MRRIRSDACVLEGVDVLCARVPEFQRAYTLCAPLPLRLKPDGFAPLLSIIMGQQVSVASARAIGARLEDAGLVTVEAVANATEDDLRACGLSRQKIRYAKALVEAGIDYDLLKSLPMEAVIAELIKIPGIGPWTAEVYAMFSLGHADAFAPGDLALQEGARLVFDLPERPTAKTLQDMAKDWAPWRSVAARLLWAYYAYEKRREGTI